MPDNIETITQYLLKAHELLRDQTEVVAELNMLLAPLIASLETHPDLSASFLAAQKEKLEVVTAIK